MNLKIKKVRDIWIYEIRNDQKILLTWGNNFKSAKEAIEAGSKRLLEFLPKETFDFGSGAVPAHQHKNGGGWVADTAHVDDTVFVGHNARVYENAHVYGNARVFEHVQIYGNARFCGVLSGHKHLNGDEKYVLVDTVSLKCFGPFNSPDEASEAMLPGIAYKIRKLEKS